MAIITNKPTSVSANSTTSLQLNKADLQAKLEALSAGAYWEDQSTWKGVAFLFENASNQKVIASFDASGNTTNLSVSEFFIDGNIECKRIDILGFANDYYTIYREDFTSASEFDIEITDGYASGGGGGGFNYVTWNNNISGHSLEMDGGIYGGPSGHWWAVANGTPIPNGSDGEFTFIINNLSGTPNDFAFGVGKQGAGIDANYFGFCWLGGELRPLLAAIVPASPVPAGLNTSGSVSIRIGKEGSLMTAYVNNVLIHTGSVTGMNAFVAGFSTSDLVPSVRTMNNSQNTGAISVYKSI